MNAALSWSNEIEELLMSWNLPQLCKTFREQEICLMSLEALTDADIVELIPKIGPRSIFRLRLNEWRQNQLNRTCGHAAVRASSTGNHSQNIQKYAASETVKEEQNREVWNEDEKEMYFSENSMSSNIENVVPNDISSRNDNEFIKSQPKAMDKQCSLKRLKIIYR